MAGNLQYVLLFLVLISIQQCIGRFRFRPTQSKAPKMPKALFSKMKNISTTRGFLKSMNMLKQEEKKGFLPKQLKVPPGIKSRSSGGVSPAGLINRDLQTCMVRAHIHFVTQPPLGQNAFIWPYAIQVPRCIGSCSVRRDIVECRAKTKVDIPLRGYRVPYDSSRKRREVMDEFAKLKDPIHHLSKRSTSGVQILSLNVEGHSECKCECAVTERMCILENKVLNKDHCQCKCPAVQNCTLPFQWDENQCKCVCGVDRTASARSCYFDARAIGIVKKWNHDKCACLCRTTLQCSSVNTFNTTTCNCECAVNAKCPANQSLQYATWTNTGMCYCK